MCQKNISEKKLNGFIIVCDRNGAGIKNKLMHVMVYGLFLTCENKHLLML
jgi:hypothetical protein